jgi:hypothetical protein
MQATASAQPNHALVLDVQNLIAGHNGPATALPAASTDVETDLSTTAVNRLTTSIVRLSSWLAKANISSRNKTDAAAVRRKDLSCVIDRRFWTRRSLWPHIARPTAIQTYKTRHDRSFRITTRFERSEGLVYD